MLSSLVVLSAVTSVAMGAFDDNIARNIMMPMSGAAYSDSPARCVNAKLPGGKMTKQVTLNCDYFSDKCSGFTFIDDSKKIIGLAFRGSSNVAQLVAEVEQSTFDAKVPFAPGGKASKYFYDAFTKLWNGGLKAEFTSLAKAHPTYTAYITGHSLGGAIASMAADIIGHDGIHPANKILLYTFGQPRTGDQDYANSHDKNQPNSFRVTHSRDIVPHIPFQWMGYFHHSHEVFYDNDMSKPTFVDCKGQEDHSCSGSHIDLSIDDHLHYYGVSVSGYGNNGCA